MIIIRLVKCLTFRKKAKYPFSSETNGTQLTDISTDKRKRRYLDNKYLDNMKYLGENLEDFIEEKFKRMGLFCANYPKLVLVIGFSFCFLMCLGYTNFQVEKDPIKLWSSDASKARQNKKYFDEHFSPFYRITQVIVEPKNLSITPYVYQHNNHTANVTVLQSQILRETYKLYESINNIVGQCDECESANKKVKLEDICFQPLHPNNLNCATQSLFQYWANDPKTINDKLSDNSYFSDLKSCMENPFQCLSAFGGPIQPFMVIGGYKDENYLSSNAIVITYVINNHNSQNREPILKAMAWEAEVLLLLKNYTGENIHIFFSTERSIEDELERETKADIKIVAISYVIMFIYLTITLGKFIFRYFIPYILSRYYWKFRGIWNVFKL
jgi:Niemann-Pick C1 protein